MVSELMPGPVTQVGTPEPNCIFFHFLPDAFRAADQGGTNAGARFVCALSYISIEAGQLVWAIANKGKVAWGGSLAIVGISGILLKR